MAPDDEAQHLKTLTNRLYRLALERAGLPWWRWLERKQITHEIHKALLDDFLRRSEGPR